MPYSASSHLEIPARPWRHVDAQRWATARPPWWLRPVWPALLLVTAAVAAMALTPDAVCSAQAPCGEQWFDATGTMLILPYLVALFALPEVAVVTAPLLVLYSADPGEWAGGAGEKIAVAVVIVALCWGWSAGAARLLARRRQRVLIREAAGGLTALAPVPGDFSPRQRGLIRVVAAALMCAAGAGVITSVVVDDRAIDREARSSAVRDVPVVAYSFDDLTLTVRLPDGRRHTFDVGGDYRGVGSVRVLLHRQSVRLASEPYGDHFVRQALGLGLAGLGLIAGVSGLLARRRAVALSEAEVPVLGVLVRQHIDGAEVFASDDTACQWPVLSYATRKNISGSLSPATAYGALCEGGILVVVRPGDRDDDRCDEVALSPIHPPVPRFSAPRASTDPPVNHGPASRRSRREAEHGRAREALVLAVSARMTPTAAPVRWRAGPGARWVAVALLLPMAAVNASFVWASSWWSLPVALTSTVMCLNGLRLLATWGITADAKGLHIRCLWSRPESVPWNVVGAARYTSAGELSIRRNDVPKEVRIGVVGWPFMERRLHRPGRAAEAAAEITAMVRDPRLRPTAGL